jgi:hypothetical protein
MNLDGDELTLTVVHDGCGGRAFVLTGHPWHMQSLRQHVL